MSFHSMLLMVTSLFHLKISLPSAILKHAQLPDSNCRCESPILTNLIHSRFSYICGELSNVVSLNAIQGT